MPINIEIEKSFERKSSLSNDGDEEAYSEDEEMKDDFFSKYITTDNTTRREMSDNMSSFVISEKGAYNSTSGHYDFNKKPRSKTNYG